MDARPARCPHGFVTVPIFTITGFVIAHIGIVTPCNVKMA